MSRKPPDRSDLEFGTFRFGKALWALLGILVLAFGLTTAGYAHADGPTTYTLEPFDFDGYFGFGTNMTQLQLGYTQCPCVKVPYVSDGMPWNNQRGADNIDKLISNGTIKDGDQVMGFSLGVQVVSLYLAQHRPPPGIRFLLVGDTFARNQELVNVHQGVPWDIENDVTMIVNQYDGWSDKPDVRNVLGYNLAANNASQGANRLHNYAQARLDHPANVVTQRGSIRHILVPTQKLPNNGWMRDWGNNPEADRVDAIQRSQIDAAYDRPGPTAEQLWAAVDEQVGMPPVPVAMRPEPVANVN